MITTLDINLVYHSEARPPFWSWAVYVNNKTITSGVGCETREQALNQALLALDGMDYINIDAVRSPH